MPITTRRRRPPEQTDRSVHTNGRRGGARTQSPPTLFGRIGALAVRRRWIVLGVWVVALLSMGKLAGGLQARLSSGGFEVPGSDSLTVQRDLEGRFIGQYPATALVVVSNASLTVDDPAFRAEVRRVGTLVSARRGVGAIQSYYDFHSPAFVSADRHTTYVVAGLEGDQNDALHEAAAVTAAAHGAREDGFQVLTGGQPAFFQRFNDVSKQDLEKAEKISFPITLLVLVLAFGTVVAAGLPVVLGVVSLIVTLGALYFLAGVTDMSIYVTNTASAIGIGVGIDYSLFVVTRFREELRSGRTVTDAVVAAVASSGRAVALSGATVIVALAGMFLVNIQAFRSMAIGSMSVVAVAVLAAVTLLPAVLSLLGARVNRVRLPFVGRTVPSGEGFWHRWALAIMRRPWTFLAGSLAVLLVLAVPFGALRLGQPGPQVLPKTEEPRVATDRLAAAFGAGVTGPVEILVDTPGGVWRLQNLATIQTLTGSLQRDPEVRTVFGPTSLAKGIPLMGYRQLYMHGLTHVDPRARPYVAGMVDWSRGATLARITVITKDSPFSKPAEDLIARIRNEYVPGAGLGGAVTARVGGATAFNLDLEHEISKRLPLVVAVVLALSFLLLMMAFRSLLLPAKAMAMNLLSVGAAYGVIVALFQWGWAAKLLGFTPDGHVEVFVPLFLFSILFGLSMDYEVFLMSRMREEYLRTGSNELAVARGLEGTARTITSAALIMVTVFVAFAMSRVVPFKEMGVGLAVAVFVDAALIRTVLVPAAMKLMGDWNWWMPASLDRWLPRIALESSTEDADPQVDVGPGRDGSSAAPAPALAGGAVTV